MTTKEFLASVSEGTIPPDLSPALQAIWQAQAGNWEAAHNIAQDIQDTNGSWIHANLHREEGDEFNAGYWYKLAGKPHCHLSLEEERIEIIQSLLEK